MTPLVNLATATGYKLEFESCFTGFGSQVATVEISSDMGATWSTLATLLPAANWMQIVIDLSAYSGSSGTSNALIAFHTADNYNQASGWAIDDVKITSPEQPVLSYQVFLDGMLLTTTDTTTYAFNPDSISYGSAHLAAVNAVYATGLSVQDTVSFASNYLYPPRNLNVTSVENAFLLTWDNPVGPDNLPLPNLLGYKLFRDGTFLAFIIADTVNQNWMLNQWPGTYCFELTAVYDLTPYGYTGTGESTKAGPACATISYSCCMPFIEDWTTGSFLTNLWIPGQNWRIAGNMGNPEPSAEFGWDPPQADYNLPLESYLIYPPTTQPTTSYKIIASFSLSLNDSTASGTENMSFDVWNGTIWDPITSFSNNGDIDWICLIDISTSAKDHPFKIRFRASGENSTNINYWLIDNIIVYIDYMPPLNLNADVISMGDVHLYWEAPEGSNNSFIHYDNGVNAGAIGTGGTAGFDVAIRFTPDQLSVYEGPMLKKIKIYTTGPACSYSVRVWTGSNAANLVADQLVTSPIVGEWNEITLDTPMPIDIAQELWIGYRCNSTAGFPAGCDEGPAVAGYGDLITLNDTLWESISQVYGLNYNWNIQGYIQEDGDSPIIPLQPVRQTTQAKAAAGKLKLDPKYKLKTSDVPKRTTAKTNMLYNSRELTGYNIYRSNFSDSAFSHVGTTLNTEFYDLNLTDFQYFYYVTASYTEGESTPSNISEVIFMAPPGINETTALNLDIYPNPATTNLTIETSGPIASLSVINILGAEIYTRQTTGKKSILLNTSGYPAGIYILHLSAANGSEIYRRFMVVK
jgi:hypothetical protein